MAILSKRDARTWHRLAGRIATVLEPQLGGRVLAGRAELRGPVWTPESFRAALMRARRRVAALNRRARVVVRTDVASFYASVTPGVLVRTLASAGVPAEDSRLAADMVEGWGSEGYSGLPVGPEGSAVLANAALRGVDMTLTEWPFLRWVDDYLVATRRERDAEEVLDRIDERLARLGLRRSLPKTAILEGGLRLRWPGTTASVTGWPAR